MFVRDGGKIHKDLKVKQTMTCQIGHDGICKTRDAPIYKACGAFVGNFQNFVLKSAKLAIGSAFRVRGFSEDGDVLAEKHFMLAYTRGSDPIICIAALLEVVDPGTGCYCFKLSEGQLDFWASSSIAGFFLRAGSKRVAVCVSDVKSHVGTCHEFTLASVGSDADVFGGDAAARRVKTFPAPVSTEDEELAARMEEGFGAKGKPGQLSKGPPAGLAKDGAVLPKAAAAAKAGAPAVGLLEALTAAPMPPPAGPPLPPPAEGPSELEQVGLNELEVDVPAEPVAVEEAEIHSEAGGADDIEGAKAVAKHAAAVKHSYARFEVRSEDLSEVVGYLVHNKRSGSLDAHCKTHEHCPGTCHMNRSLTGNNSGNRSAQGRPVGHLVAWLWAGASCHKDQHGLLRIGQSKDVNDSKG